MGELAFLHGIGKYFLSTQVRKKVHFTRLRFTTHKRPTLTCGADADDRELLALGKHLYSCEF